MFDEGVSSIGGVHQAGELRAIGVRTAKRLEVLPDVPVIRDFLPGYEASGWNGIGAPRNTPPESSKNSTEKLIPPSPTRN